MPRKFTKYLRRRVPQPTIRHKPEKRRSWYGSTPPGRVGIDYLPILAQLIAKQVFLVTRTRFDLQGPLVIARQILRILQHLLTAPMIFRKTNDLVDALVPTLEINLREKLIQICLLLSKDKSPTEIPGLTRSFFGVLGIPPSALVRTAWATLPAAQDKVTSAVPNFTSLSLGQKMCNRRALGMLLPWVLRSEEIITLLLRLAICPIKFTLPIQQLPAAEVLQAAAILSVLKPFTGALTRVARPATLEGILSVPI